MSTVAPSPSVTRSGARAPSSWPRSSTSWSAPAAVTGCRRCARVAAWPTPPSSSAWAEPRGLRFAEAEAEHRALTSRVVVDLHGRAEPAGDHADEGQAEAHSGLGLALAAREPLEDPFAEMGGHPRPVVDDLDDELIALGPRRHRGRAAVLDGVVDQHSHGMAEEAGVDVAPHVRRDVDGDLDRIGGVVGGVGQELSQ